MKQLITLLLLTSGVHSFSQDIEKYYDYNWKECVPNDARFYSAIFKTDSGYVRKDYFIHEKSIQMVGKYLDADLKIQNGSFYYFHPNGILDGFGKYINGKKDGLWLHYYSDRMPSDSVTYQKGHVIGTSLSWHPNGYVKDSSVINEDGKGVNVGWFDNGNPSFAGLIINGTKPTGNWKFFHKTGAVSSIETYKDGALTNKLYFDEDGKAIDTTDKDSEASFPGGSKAWLKYLEKKIYFPDQYKIVNGDKAVVVVSFAINEDGVVEDVNVSTPFYPQFDIIAKKAIANSPKWIPAISHNRRVKAWRRQPVTFAQSE